MSQRARTVLGRVIGAIDHLRRSRSVAITFLAPLIPIAVLGFVLGNTVKTGVEGRALANAKAGAELVARVAIQPQLTPSDLVYGLTPERLVSLDQSMRAGLIGNDVVRLKIWNRDHRVVYSDDKALIGHTYPSSDELDAALAGQTASEVSTLSKAENVTERGSGRLLEVYVPLRLDGDVQPAGALELYQPYQPIATAIEHDTSQLYLVLAVGLIALYGALLRILDDSDKLRRRAADKEHASLHDPLTALANRSLFKNRVEHALEARQRDQSGFAIAFVDLDDFKTINDTLGHSAGDDLLREVARRLVACVRSSDTVARLGGDEFAILLAGVSESAGAAAVAERIMSALRVRLNVQGAEVTAEGSLGIVMVKDGVEADDLLRQADIAMYTAKAAGKGRYEFFERKMQVSALERMRLEGDLRAAVEREEFCVLFQPILDLDSGRITGAEALVRWRHPERGMLTPDQFISVAESTGLIVPMGQIVLEQSCRIGRDWHDRYPDHDPLTINVNLSARQVQDPDLVGSVARALGASQFDPRYLVLEITETVMMERAHDLIARLYELKGLGVKLAIDDFGTGYSSLSYLQFLPVDILKLDRSFVDGIDKSSEGAALAAAIIKVGEALHLETVAEGIEQTDQLIELRAMDCSHGQGYLFARPMAEDAMADFLSRSADGARWIAALADDRRGRAWQPRLAP